MALKEKEEIVAVELEQFAVGQRNGGRCARAAIQQSELAEETSFDRVHQYDLLAGVVTDEQLDLTAPDDEERLAGMAGFEQRMAGGYVNRIDDRRKAQRDLPRSAVRRA
jgi:hypothetical protein